MLYNPTSAPMNSPQLKALEALSENFYDIVIVDYKIPELSGLDFLIREKLNWLIKGIYF